MSGKFLNKRIAIAMGGMSTEYQNKYIDAIAGRCVHYGMKPVFFFSLSNGFDGKTHTIGEHNIYNLVNFKSFDALIVLPIAMKSAECTEMLIEKAKESKVPVVVIDGQFEGCYNVMLGYEHSIEDIVEHFIVHHGFTEINFVAGMPDNEVSDARTAAYKRTLRKYGLPVEEDRIDFGWFWEGPAGEFVERYYKSHGKMPQAFVCANDSMAIGVHMKLTEMGFRVPEDVCVSGIDGIKEAMTYSPSITTARFNIKGSADAAIDKLAQMFEKNEILTGSEIVEGEVLYRHSCGCEPMSAKFDNDIKHQLYKNFDMVNDFSTTIIHMIDDVTSAEDMQSSVQAFKHFIEKLWCAQYWVCLCEDFVSDTIGADAALDGKYRVKGYPEEMVLAIYANDKKATIYDIYDRKNYFKSEDILPSFDNVDFSGGNILICPLHFQDRTVGYAAINFEYAMDNNFYIYNNFLVNVGMLLENARVKSKLKATVSTLENMYVHDSMTSLFNRRGFYQFTPKLFNRCIETGETFMVLSVDLDGLKPINDIHGHKEGDNAICTVAKALQECACKGDICARFGGDEFVVAGIETDDRHADDYIDRINEFLRKYNETSDKPYKVRASFGLLKSVPSPSDTLDELIKVADEAMYKQKQSKNYRSRR